MAINRKCCQAKHDFQKKPRTGSITSRKPMKAARKARRLAKQGEA